MLLVPHVDRCEMGFSLDVVLISLLLQYSDVQGVVNYHMPLVCPSPSFWPKVCVQWFIHSVNNRRTLSIRHVSVCGTECAAHPQWEEMYGCGRDQSDGVYYRKAEWRKKH